MDKATQKGRRRRVLWYVAGAILAVAFVVYYTMFDPGVHAEGRGIFPVCLIKTVTGFDCPGCGIQRGLHCLFTGHPLEALRFNFYMAFALPVLALLLVSGWQRTRWPRLYRVMYSRTMGVVLIASVLLWTVLRNVLGV